jgi:hypothetical protein
MTKQQAIDFIITDLNAAITLLEQPQSKNSEQLNDIAHYIVLAYSGLIDLYEKTKGEENDKASKKKSDSASN